MWYQILIPTLLPFIIITNTLSETNSYLYLTKKIQGIFQSDTNELILIILGNLCGYPIGGIILNQFIKKNLISAERKNTLLPLASQASPMFIIGYIYSNILNKQYPLFILLFAIYIPTIIAYIASQKKKPTYHNSTYAIHNKEMIITESFLQAAKTIVLIGIYVMIFSIAYEILLPFCNHSIFKLILSSLEITTGLNVIKSINMNEKLMLPFIGMLSTFGGFCSIFQIKCVISFDTKKYLQTKLLLSVGSFIILFLYRFLILFIH
ncbi:MAG: hypothetical protein ACI4F4_04250 [Lachnospiraceae bacterium]